MKYAIVVFDDHLDSPDNLSRSNLRLCSSVEDAHAYLERKWGVAERSGDPAKAWLLDADDTSVVIQKWRNPGGDAEWMKE